MTKHILSLTKTLLRNILPVLRARFYFRKAVLQGSKIRIWGHPSIHILGKMVINDRVRIISTITPVELVVDTGAIFEIGENTYINYGVSISAKHCVKIGRDCLIGTYVNITDNNFHYVDPDRRNEIPPSSDVTIEDNVWLGTRVIVLPGVTIGKDSVIGAGSVVTHSIPSRVIAAGAPAKIIREL
ncbi:MAG: acyltransferase [Alphaproteobacteria bacterium]|nr:MAG: acyltransferase [Alphaproteobacteria bacterium]